MLTLIERAWPGSFGIRQNGKVPGRRQQGSLSTTVARLRHWMVARVRRN